MPSFRVTKYNPQNRDERGHYTHNEWTSISDVGKRFDSVVLTLADYLGTEERYLQAIALFMGLADIQRLTIRGLETYHGYDSPSDLPPRTSLTLAVEGKSLNQIEVLEVARLNLREIIWCRLQGGAGFFVHFGYDYYMFMGGDRLPSTPTSVPGLFIEPFPSPYEMK